MSLGVFLNIFFQTAMHSGKMNTLQSLWSIASLESVIIIVLTWNVILSSVFQKNFVNLCVCISQPCRVFHNPPVVDIFERITRDLLLRTTSTIIWVLDGIDMSMRVEPALFTVRMT